MMSHGLPYGPVLMTIMLKVKNNYKREQNGIVSRIYKTTEEMQQHILEECQGLHPDDSTKVTKVDDLFDEEIPKLTETVKIFS